MLTEFLEVWRVTVSPGAVKHAGIDQESKVEQVFVVLGGISELVDESLKLE